MHSGSSGGVYRAGSEPFFEIERGSGNALTDLGRPDADARLVKAELVTHINEIIRRRRLTSPVASAPGEFP